MAKVLFKAFVKTKDNLESAKEFATAKGLADVVIKGDITTAIEQLNGTPSPEYLLVELAVKDSNKAFEELDKLANVCDPDTKVIVCGTLDELSFYKELIKMGVAEYLLNPVKAAQLEKTTAPKAETVTEKVIPSARPRDDSRVIVVIGTRGGSGASTVAVNLAGIYASRNYPTAVLDLDPEFGTIPLMVDVEASKGFVDALEKPDRVDSLFLDRVMTKVNDSLFVIGAEKNLLEPIRIDEEAPEKILRQLQTKFPYIIVDLNHVPSYTHQMLKTAEVIIVTELSIAGLRDTMRIHDLIKDQLKNDKIYIVANREGLGKKYQTPVKDFENGLGKKLDAVLPFEQEAYGYNDSGKIFALAPNPKSKLLAALQELAGKFMPEAVGVKKEEKKKGGFFSKK